MAQVLILGAGVMGSAFCFPLVDAGHSVRLVGTHLDREWILSVRETGVHTKLKMKLPETVLPFTHDQLGEALSAAIDLIVLGVSSSGVDWAVGQLGPLLKTPPPILMLTKGLKAHRDTLQILPEAVREGLFGHGIERVEIGAVGGPCIAGELAARRETSVVIACAHRAILERIIRLAAAPYYHARPSADIIGVETCAAFKNFYALAVGYPAGLLAKQGKASNDALMYNLAAALFSQGLAEMKHLVNFMGGTSASVDGLAGAGDLYVTCQAGRNSRMGYYLGSGMRYGEAKARYMAGDTIEGAELALAIGSTLHRLFERRYLERRDLPLATAIFDAICHDRPLEIPWTEFFS
jgi:glycerol-3-phosphate dehydrogenase (NAD(P)+)